MGWQRSAVWGMLILGLVVRVVLAWTTDGYDGDIRAFGDWAGQLANAPLRGFYEVEDFRPNEGGGISDHLPGDLYIHAALARMFVALGGEDFHGQSYEFLLKLVPTLADIGIAYLIYRLICKTTGQLPGYVALALIALNPAIIFNSAIWGQWDSLSMLILLAGFVIVILRPSRWILSIPIYGWAVLIKPQLAVIALVSLVFIPLKKVRDGATFIQAVRQQLPNVLVALVLGLTTMTLLLLPFDTALPGVPARWSLLDRAQIALDLYPNTTLGAANIWMLSGDGMVRQSDQVPGFLGFSAQNWGVILMAGALLAIGAVFVRCMRSVSSLHIVLWAMAVIAFAYFLFPTRVHERYMLPTVVLLVFVAGVSQLDRWITIMTVLASLTYFANLWLVFSGSPDNTEELLLAGLGLFNLGLFMGLLWVPFRWNRNRTSAAAGVDTPHVLTKDNSSVEPVASH